MKEELNIKVIYSQETLNYELIVENLTTGANINFNISWVEIINMFCSHSTATSTYIQQAYTSSLIDRIYINAYSGGAIPLSYAEHEFKNLIYRELYNIFISRRDVSGHTTTISIIKKPVKKEDEGIKEAAKLSEKAMKYKEEINKMIKEIKEDRLKYYKKHGTFIDVIKEYIGKMN